MLNFGEEFICLEPELSFEGSGLWGLRPQTPAQQHYPLTAPNIYKALALILVTKSLSELIMQLICAFENNTLSGLLS